MKLQFLFFITGIVLLCWGLWGAWEAGAFLKRSELVQATVTGRTGMRTLEREAGECTAYSKGCAATVFYTLENGTSKTAVIAQPLFARTKQDKITLAVDPQDSENPRIASVHVLFRNPLIGIAFGIVLSLIPGVLLHSRKMRHGASTKIS